MEATLPNQLNKRCSKNYFFNRYFTILLTAVMLITFSVQAQNNGSISGTVKSADGKPIEGATISIAILKVSVITNDEGEFRISRVPEGTYMVTAKYLSLQARDQEVAVTIGKSVNVKFVMTETSEELEEVSISSGRINKFGNKSSDMVARMPLANLENPQTYSVIGKELIEEQQIVDFKETLRNSPGVIPNNNPAGGTGGTIRGFFGTTTVRNGLAVQSYQSDPINMERVEVIKGPSGTLFGSSIISFGGLINQVTKKPFDTFKGEVSASLGSYELSRLTADINTPLNADKTVLLRVNAAQHKENSFQNYGFKRMFTFAPSLIYKVSDKLTFLFEAEISKTNRSTVAYYLNLNLSPYKNFKDIPLPFTSSLGGPNLDAELSATNVFGEAKYKISDVWTSTTSIAYGENQIDHSHQIYPTFSTLLPPTSFNRNISSYGPRIFTSINAQQNFNADFKIGNVRNRFLGGISVYSYRGTLRFTDAGTYDVINLNNLNTTTSIPGINLEKLNTIIAGKTQQNTENTQASYSAYASDVINVTDNLLAMLSIRADRFQNDPQVVNGIKSVTGGYGQLAFSPKFGLVYQVVKDKVSLFGNYMNGFSNVSPITQPDGSILPAKPRQANQLEGGIKLEVFNKRLNATFGYYDIRISNDNLIVNGFTSQGATSRSKGFELEVIANPVEGLNVIAGYATNAYKITKATANVNVGNYQAQTPTKSGNLWVSYKFTGNTLKNFGLGFGGNYVAACFFDATNTIVIPSYTVINASAFYDQPKWRFGLKVNNLADTKYWTNYGIPETLRQIIGTISFKF